MSQAVHDMFADIAPKYDWANDVLSFGIHRLWRRQALRLAALPKNATLVDVCTGTGDVAFVAARTLSADAKVIGVDFVYPMLTQARAKQRKLANSQLAQVQFVHGDALHLPLPDSIADGSIVSFGIRNVDDPVAGLREMARVVKANGAVIVLEFGQPTLPLFSFAYTMYSRWIMPLIGALLTGNRKAYEYLPETAQRFPAGDAFLALMQEAGLEERRAKPLLFGLAYIYIGRRTS